MQDGDDAAHPEGGFGGIVRRPPAKPIIAAVEGFAVAGGLEIALACDLVVAARITVNAPLSLIATKRYSTSATTGATPNAGPARTRSSATSPPPPTHAKAPSPLRSAGTRSGSAADMTPPRTPNESRTEEPLMLQEGLSHWLPDPDAVPALRAVTVADLLDEAVERSPDVEALVYYAYDDPELTLGGADDALGPRRGDTRSGRSLGSLRTVISGGSVVPPSLGNGWQQRLGVSFVITYGQTEHGPLAAVTTPRDSPERQITAVGRPIPHAALEVVEPGTDTRVPIGVEGELRFRGYVMRPSGDRGGRQPGRLAAVGRPRADRRGRLRTDHRQGQGHDHPRR